MADEQRKGLTAIQTIKTNKKHTTTENNQPNKCTKLNKTK